MDSPMHIDHKFVVNQIPKYGHTDSLIANLVRKREGLL